MRSIRFWFFPILIIILASYISIENIDVLNKPNNIGRHYLKELKQGRFGYGLVGNYNNGISFAGLEVGDIILGGYPECAYGRFSHAGIYIGDDLVLESYGDLGVVILPIRHYLTYSEIALLRVETDAKTKEKAVEYARGYEGGVFYPIAFKPGNRIWNCSKIIWQAYGELGIELDESRDLWVAPEQFYHSHWTRVIREKSQ